ncbi:CynX/NimT family MFS transporter [Liquorilactobacillus mali]|uniref:CynX/NimT family MFS transporter n=1 Tax=Liquorilactobacillus mali TaxID=1618 RepID=UPI000ADBE84A|nr:MFS transporter [Liquorilactobacillus mali]
MKKLEKKVLIQSLTLLLIILIGANLRTPLTAVPPILNNISSSFNLPTWFLGSMTTIPLLCFAIISPFVSQLSRKFGILTTITIAIIGLLIGSLFRVYSFPTLLVGTLLIGSSIAILNVLSPVLVAKFYPHKIGLMTSAYTFSMTIFSALSAGFSAPLSARIGWKSTLQWLVVIPVITLLVLFWQRDSKKANHLSNKSFVPAEQLKSIWHQPLAWYLTFYMGLQSFLFYTILTWLPSIFVAHGISQNQSSFLLGLMQLSSLPVAYLIPNLASHLKKQTFLIWMIFCLFIFGFSGLLFKTSSLFFAAIICILLGFATNSAFCLSMVLFSLKTNNPDETSAMSGMAQSIGYLVASIGPVLSGIMHSLTNSWNLVILMLLALVIIQTIFGLMIDKKKTVFG